MKALTVWKKTNEILQKYNVSEEDTAKIRSYFNMVKTKGSEKPEVEDKKEEQTEKPKQPNTVAGDPDCPPDIHGNRAKHNQKIVVFNGDFENQDYPTKMLKENGVWGYKVRNLIGDPVFVEFKKNKSNGKTTPRYEIRG